MEYDPFVRGPFPVGVRSGNIIDTRRDGRQLPFEVWYPALPNYYGFDLNLPTQDAFTIVPDTAPLRQAAGRDSALYAGKYPLVVFSHSSLGHRRQSSFLCTHLASHGYIVAAADHTGNTFGDWVTRAAGGEEFTPAKRDAYIEEIVAHRVPDLRLLIDELLDGAAGDVSGQVDAQHIGLIGWSLGGWTVLATPEVEERCGAVVALAPAGSSNPVPGVIPVTLTFEWKQEVPTLFLVAERDRFTPLAGMYELFERTPSSKAMFILRHADHDHFGDDIQGALIPEQHAHLFTRSLALAHLDAALKGDQPAQEFLAQDAVASLRERGVDVLAYAAEATEG